MPNYVKREDVCEICNNKSFCKEPYKCPVMRVPAFWREYKELEYIEETGTQYIDTGVYPNECAAAVDVKPYSFPFFSIKGYKIYDKDGLLLESWKPVCSSNGVESMCETIHGELLSKEAFLEKMNEFAKKATKLEISFK